MKHLKTPQAFNESLENFSIEPLFDDAFNDKKVMSKISWFKNEIKEKYKNGFIPLSMNWSSECRIIDGNIFLYDYFNNKLFIKGRALGGLIYDNGSWAESC